MPPEPGPVYRYTEAGMCRSGSDAMCRSGSDAMCRSGSDAMCRSGSDAMCRFGSDAMLRQDVCPVLQTRRWPTSQRKCGDT